MQNPTSPLVDTRWLQDHLGSPDLIVLDASWYMPAAERDGELEWRKQRIPGSRFFDFDRRICLADTELPHMMPTAADFQIACQELGIYQDSLLVIYDGAGLFSAPRAWWMFQAMGHTRCVVLNGGLPAWITAGAELETNEPPTNLPRGDFIAKPDPTAIVDVEYVLSILDLPSSLVIDARPADRFAGKAPEPRAGLACGHMPGAVNLPFGDLVHDGKIRPAEELRPLFEQLLPSAAPVQELVFSCGSGVTACVAALAARVAGYGITGGPDLRVYDGSWCEWGGRADLPVVPAR